MRKWLKEIVSLLRIELQLNSLPMSSFFPIPNNAGQSARLPGWHNLVLADGQCCVTFHCKFAFIYTLFSIIWIMKSISENALWKSSKNVEEQKRKHCKQNNHWNLRYFPAWNVFILLLEQHITLYFCQLKNHCKNYYRRHVMPQLCFLMYFQTENKHCIYEKKCDPDTRNNNFTLIINFMSSDIFILISSFWMLFYFSSFKM